MKKILCFLLILLCILAVAAQDFRINNRIPAHGFSADKKTWKYEQSTSFKKGDIPPEFLLNEIRLKVHKKYAHIRGYNEDITFMIKAPGPVRTLEWSAVMTNFTDRTKRKVSMSYSLDGVNFKNIDQKEFIPSAELNSGMFRLPVNRGLVFLKLQRHVDKKDSNGRYGFVLWTNMKLKLTGDIADKSTLASPGKPLKTVFPTGVFWAWERTQQNADFAKMELWDFVEYSMKTLKENGYNTCWFVNIGAEHQLKVLTLAEKYGLNVLTNTSLFSTFYRGIDSFAQLDQLADNSAARLSHYKSLLGYVLKDEPLICDLDTCNYFYDLMKKADPARDSVAVIMNRQSLTYLRDSRLPVICSDLYYFGDKDSKQIPAPLHVSQAEITNALNCFNLSAERHGKHSWFMGQMFGDIWGRYYVKNGKAIVYPGCYLHWKMPTEAESEWQVWEALRLGSKGIFFYILHPGVPLTVPPEKASTPAEKKKVAYMDKQAAIVAKWKHQKLVKKQIESDWVGCMTRPGGKPTPQMLATAPVMKMIRANEKLLLDRRRAPFPVFFATDEKTNTQTFCSGNRWLGIVVNRDLENARTVSVYLPRNVKAVKDLVSGKMLEVTSVNAHFQKTELTLKAGSGAFLESVFYTHPGLRFALETFDHYAVHHVKLNTNAEIFHHGNFAADENRALRLKKSGNPQDAVCALLGISKPKTPVVTYSKSLPKRMKGTIFCMVRGKLTQADIQAVQAGQKGEQANIQHLRLPQRGKLEAMNGKSIKKDKFYLPAIVPNESSAIQFFLGPKDFIDDITLWFVPDPVIK